MARGAPTLIPECQRLAADVTALSDDALRLWADQLERWARQGRVHTAPHLMHHTFQTLVS
jgi:hypothetical protein